MPKKFKYCCINRSPPHIPSEVLEHFRNLPKEPFDRGGILTGRSFIDTTFKGRRIRAVGGTVYARPLDETFHLFLLRTFFDCLTKQWVDQECRKEKPHPIIQWHLEAQAAMEKHPEAELISGVEMTGGMKSLLSLAYDFYSLKHCTAPILPKLLSRLKNEREFQGARYEVAIGGLVSRAGFQINWANEKTAHCEFVGTHKVTGDKIAFEAKSHRREGVLGQGDGIFDPATARIKVMDHVREAIGQCPAAIPLVVLDDLNLPLSAGQGLPLHEKTWFNDVDAQLKKYRFFELAEYERCGALGITNFSWHFHYQLPHERNEVLIYFRRGGKYALKDETIQYLRAAVEQHGHVPAKLDELESHPN